MCANEVYVVFVENFFSALSVRSVAGRGSIERDERACMCEE